MSSNSCLYGLQSLEKVSRVLFEKAISIFFSYILTISVVGCYILNSKYSIWHIRGYICHLLIFINTK